MLRKRVTVLYIQKDTCQPITCIKAKEIIRKIRFYPCWFPCPNQPFLNATSWSDDFQSMKLDQIKSHAFLQHSTLSLTQQVLSLSLLYEVVVAIMKNGKIPPLKILEFLHSVI